MHIILGILGSIVTILYLVHRLKGAGIDLGWLNPFHWHHRNSWRKKVNADPVFSLTSPMEAAAGLLYTAAKLSGDISSEQKSLMLEIFETDFKLSEREAVELLSSCAFLIKDEDKVFDNLDKYLAASKESFAESQIESTLELVDKMLALEAKVFEKQAEFKERLKKYFQPQAKQKNTW